MSRSQSKDLGTFWHGNTLSALDVACLMTFVRFGFSVTVYSYDSLPGLPSELKRANAADIVDRSFLFGFMFMGRPSFSHFSDLFRYRLFEQTGMAWIDADMLALREFQIPQAGNFLAKETPSGINGAIMRIDPADDRLAHVIRLTEEYAASSKFTWGATGPALITKVFGSSAVAEACGVERFYAVGLEDWWKPFTPDLRDWCAERCQHSDALHLWNNVLEKAGYWKDLAPPTGSFLNEVFDKYGLLKYFKESYPPSVIDHLRKNYINSRTGGNFRLSELASLTTRRVGALVRRSLSV